MKAQRILASALLVASATHAAVTHTSVRTQDDPSLTSVSTDVHQALTDSLGILASQRAAILEQKLPLTDELRALEAELAEVEGVLSDATRERDGRILNLTNLTRRITQRQGDIDYLTTSLFGPFAREFEARLHVSEADRYDLLVDAAKDAPEVPLLPLAEMLGRQAGLLSVAIDRIEDLHGGARFPLSVVDKESLVREGTCLLVGPSAIFRSTDGTHVGGVDRFVNSEAASLIAFDDPLLTEAASALVETGEGTYPLDPTLGNAHKIAATQESLLEHIQNGGPVMIPIFTMAGLALLIALYKWLTLAFVRKPSSKQINELMEAVGTGEEEEAMQRARRLPGPVGRMLAAGVEAMHAPRDLVEEVMYERVLRTRLRLQRMLPFIQICAASAPLLGLLGTVTGIINTFEMIKVFGSGDVKSLSGGISEALITTKFGLVVAIPSLLLHAFLSRKARAIVGHMETSAVTFMNRLGKSDLPRPGGAPMSGLHSQPDPNLVREQVKEVLQEILGSSGSADVVQDAAPAQPAG